MQETAVEDDPTPFRIFPDHWSSAWKKASQISDHLKDNPGEPSQSIHPSILWIQIISEISRRAESINPSIHPLDSDHLGDIQASRVNQSIHPLDSESLEGRPIQKAACGGTEPPVRGISLLL